MVSISVFRLSVNRLMVTFHWEVGTAAAILIQGNLLLQSTVPTATTAQGPCLLPAEGKRNGPVGRTSTTLFRNTCEFPQMQPPWVDADRSSFSDSQALSSRQIFGGLQDYWRLRPNFTLNLGYGYGCPPFDARNMANCCDPHPTTHSHVAGGRQRAPPPILHRP